MYWRSIPQGDPNNRSDYFRFGVKMIAPQRGHTNEPRTQLNFCGNLSTSCQASSPWRNYCWSLLVVLLIAFRLYLLDWITLLGLDLLERFLSPFYCRVREALGPWFPSIQSPCPFLGLRRKNQLSPTNCWSHIPSGARNLYWEKIWVSSTVWRQESACLTVVGTRRDRRFKRRLQVHDLSEQKEDLGKEESGRRPNFVTAHPDRNAMSSPKPSK